MNKFSERRSNQFNIMAALLSEGAITLEDLNDFNGDLKDSMKFFSERF